jgi:hypothetical protein
MYTNANVATIQLPDIREIPTTIPSIVARITPMMETNMVFVAATIKA